MATSENIIALEAVERKFLVGDIEVPALRGVSLTIGRGDFVALLGPSGSGKSTLLYILGCLDRPTGGRYYLDGRDVSGLSADEQAEVRNRKMGFVFQAYGLLPRKTALENVELPLIYAGVPAQKRRERAAAMLTSVGLGDRLDHAPLQLSGGQQQRVAIARGLVSEPELLFADEPTGNLDTKTSYEVMEILTKLSSKGITIVLVTHEADIAAYAQRRVTLRDGEILSDERGAPTS